MLEDTPKNPAPRSARWIRLHVNQPAAIAQTSRNLVDHLSDLGDGLLYRRCDLRILMVNDASNLKRRFCVESLRSFVLALGSELLKQVGLVVFSFLRSGAGHLPATL